MIKKIVDVHTHIYLERYIQVLKARTKVPRIFKNNGQDRLIILPHEDIDDSTRLGRPIGPEYYDPSVKKEFMSKHQITHSILSLGNPWLDFLDPSEAAPLASALNQDLQAYCQNHEQFYGFGVLPTSSPKDCVLELENIAALDKLRGAIIGTHGAGKGLDDPEYFQVFETASKLGQMLFLHPHYGIDPEHYGTSQSNGHVLPLALGFPFETTISISRMILAGVFDKFPNLKILVAHSGGVLPFLAGRLDSCVEHDPHVCNRLNKKPSDYLKSLYYDAVNYHAPGLKCLHDLVGRDRVMFGTDNPFFPPLDGNGRWASVDNNLDAIAQVFGPNDQDVLSQNAIRILNLK